MSKKLPGKRVVLVVLDGYGIGAENQTNPVYTSKLEAIGRMRRDYGVASIQASGIAVGLPWGEESNSEVGHLTMGAGRIVFENYPRIEAALRDGSFYTNERLLESLRAARGRGARVHLVGLVGESNVHSSFEHLKALLTVLAKEGIEDYALHVITDGRDSAPRSARALVEKLPGERIASIAGRYYAMDRDTNSDRTERAVRAICGEGVAAESAREVFESHYARDLSDEFIEPTVLGNGKLGATDGDLIVCFNFREDRMRPLVRTILDKKPAIRLITMIRYDRTFTLPVIFPPEEIRRHLGEVIAEHGLTQLRIAESEKQAHVTYFFNGAIEPPLPGEYRIILPSQNVAHYDEHPEMMAREITDRVVTAVEERVYDFILVNYANPDMVAHTGNFAATERALHIIDDCVARLVDACTTTGTVLVVTSDHGNAERLANPKTGERETKHDASPVPLYVVGEGFERPKSEGEIRAAERAVTGSITDIAPTILEIMGLEKPEEMTGESLIPDLR